MKIHIKVNGKTLNSEYEQLSLETIKEGKILTPGGLSKPRAIIVNAIPAIQMTLTVGLIPLTFLEKTKIRYIYKIAAIEIKERTKNIKKLCKKGIDWGTQMDKINPIIAKMAPVKADKVGIRFILVKFFSQ